MTIPDRRRLEADLRQVEEQLKTLELRLETRPEFGHSRGSARAYAWEMALARREITEARLERLRKALDRLREGDYGQCQRCGGFISPERLEILPVTTMCVTCAQELTQRAAGRTAAVHTPVVK